MGRKKLKVTAGLQPLNAIATEHQAAINIARGYCRAGNAYRIITR